MGCNDIDLTHVDFAAIETEVRRHLASLPSAIDSFLEEHILGSKHYRIQLAGEDAGFASIYEERLICQFSLLEPYRHFGQPAYARLRRMEQVQSAFVPTCDEFYLAHALDDYRQLARQAYFFAYPADTTPPSADGVRLRHAEPDDADLIRRESGDFFETIERHIERRELFVTMRGDEPAGFGLIVPSAFLDNVASIGMFTCEEHRQTGIGTATIQGLIERCLQSGIRPVAGCWYYNHGSKRTLERAGLYTGTRLLKIDY